MRNCKAKTNSLTIRVHELTTSPTISNANKPPSRKILTYTDATCNGVSTSTLLGRLFVHPFLLTISSSFEQQLTVREVAKLMACSESHVVKLYEDGELTGTDISRRGAKQRELRFSHDDLDQFAALRQTQQVRPQPTKPQLGKRHPQKHSTSMAGTDSSGWFKD